MKIAKVGLFEIHLPHSGGKAGKGRNLTTSVQVRMDGNIVKSFRVEATSKSIAATIKKVGDWCRANPLGPI